MNIQPLILFGLAQLATEVSSAGSADFLDLRSSITPCLLISYHLHFH
jgi:hypothetical protein